MKEAVAYGGGTLYFLRFRRQRASGTKKVSLLRFVQNDGKHPKTQPNNRENDEIRNPAPPQPSDLRLCKMTENTQKHTRTIVKMTKPANAPCRSQATPVCAK
jgi:hypothetical protein